MVNLMKNLAAAIHFRRNVQKNGLKIQKSFRLDKKRAYEIVTAVRG